MKKMTTRDFIIKAINIHDDKYDYSLVDYKTSHEKVKIICTTHGIFKQTPNNHLHAQGCPKCTNNKKMTTRDFIAKAINIHGNRYDYSLVNYKNSQTKIKIICSIHGVFEQRPDNHMLGNGCDLCAKKSKGEIKIKKILMEKNIIFNQEKRFNECRDKRVLPFDFYLPEYNLCIEYDGIQHFKAIDFFGGDKYLIYIQKHDQIKNNYCKKNNINLLRIQYNDNIEKTMKNNGII